MGKLDGKVAAITGAGGGIGRARALTPDCLSTRSLAIISTFGIYFFSAPIL